MLSRVFLANSWTVVFSVRPVENEPAMLRPPVGPLWVFSAGGQQDQAQMYKGNSSSSTSAVFPLDPAFKGSAKPEHCACGIAHAGFANAVSTQDPRTQHWAAPPEERGGEHYVVLFLENDSPCFSIFLVW